MAKYLLISFRTNASSFGDSVRRRFGEVYGDFTRFSRSSRSVRARGRAMESCGTMCTCETEEPGAVCGRVSGWSNVDSS